MSESLFINTLKNDMQSMVPFWFMRQAGRYLPEYRKIREQFPSFLDFCYTPDAACEVTLQPINRFDMDAAILFSDILVIPHAMGQDVWFVKGEGPKLQPLKNIQDIEKLKTDSVINFLSPVFEAIQKIRTKLAPEKALIGFSGSPWTLACYMIEGKGSKDFANVREFAYLYPDAFALMIDQLVEAISLYLIKQIKSGVDAVQLFDSWAGLVSEAQFSQWVIEPTARIVSNVKKACPEIPIIGFAKSSGANIIDYALKTDVDAVGVDTTVPLLWVKDQLGGKVVLQGNLDPAVIASDRAQAVKQTQHILESWREIPFVFNLGHGIVPHAPIENVQAVCDTIRAFKR